MRAAAWASSSGATPSGAGTRPTWLRRCQARQLGGIVKAEMGWGSYAYALPRRAVPAVVGRIRRQLRKATTTAANLGLVLAELTLLARRGWIRKTHPVHGSTGRSPASSCGGGGAGGGYVSTPLLVDHRTGTSETWRGIRKVLRPFEGSSAWWNFTKPGGV